MNRTYECMVLLDNREVRQGWEPLKATVAEMFAKSGAEIVSARRWDERRLAYPINGQARGTYLLVYYTAETGANAQLRRDLELSEIVLRHLVTTCEQVPEDAFEPEAEFDVTAIPEGDQEPVAAAEEPAAEEPAAGEAKAEAAEEQPADEQVGDENAADETAADDGAAAVTASAQTDSEEASEQEEKV